MEIKKYSIAVDKNKNHSRIGCTVCKNKITNDNLVLNSSSYKHWQESKHFKNSITKTKYEGCDKNKMTPVIKPKVNECYCNYMDQIKKELFPKIICSKRFKLPSLIDIDDDWLNEIIEFRRENWFDCHADSFVDAISIQNVNHFFECDKLETENTFNMNMESPTTHVKNVVDKKKPPKINLLVKRKTY